MTSSRPGNALWIVLLWAELLGAAAAEPPVGGERRTMTLEQLRQQRQQIARRPRRILFNNDGCDCLYFPRDQKATADSFLARRTADLAGTHVDAIAYCTISSGFGHFTHRTQVGEVLTRSASEFGIHPHQRNCAQDLIEQGTDCLQTVLSFAHRHDSAGGGHKRLTAGPPRSSARLQSIVRHSSSESWEHPLGD